MDPQEHNSMSYWVTAPSEDSRNFPLPPPPQIRTSCINSRGRFHFTPVSHTQLTNPTCMCREELKGKTGQSILRLSCGRSLTRTHPSPLETHAGQLLWSLAARVGVNTHRRNSAWTLSSCKHVETAQKQRRVQALTLLHTKQIWVNKEPKKTPQRCALLTSSQFPTPALKSLVSSSFGLQLPFPSGKQLSTS